MATLFQPEDLNVLPPLAITRHSHPGRELMNRFALVGSITNTLVERASASMAVCAVTDTLELNLGDSPVLGSTI